MLCIHTLMVNELCMFNYWHTSRHESSQSFDAMDEPPRSPAGVAALTCLPDTADQAAYEECP